MGYFTLVTVLMQVVLVTVTAFCYDLQLFTPLKRYMHQTQDLYIPVYMYWFFYLSFLPVLLYIYHDQHNQELKYLKKYLIKKKLHEEIVWITVGFKDHLIINCNWGGQMIDWQYILYFSLMKIGKHWNIDV